MDNSSFAELPTATTATTWKDSASWDRRRLPIGLLRRTANAEIVHAIVEAGGYDDAFAPQPTGATGEGSPGETDRLRQAQARTLDLGAAFFDDYGKELLAASSRSFECFMQYNDVSQPLLGAEPSGVLVATWTHGAECLSIRFNERHRLAFAISYFDGDAYRRDWGESTLSTFFEDCTHGKRIASN